MVGNQYFEFDEAILTNDILLAKIRPFEWLEEFPFLQETSGFDAIIGNPPYVRVQNLVKYFKEEITYYQNRQSGFTTALHDNFDKYYLFIEKAITLLKDGAKLGYIVPHKFFVVKGGIQLRTFITENTSISKIIHFGVTQVFPDRSTYTAILILEKGESHTLKFQRISAISAKELADPSISLDYPTDRFSSSPWVFVSPRAIKIFKKLDDAGTTPLSSLADIVVGLQTSADKVYIITDFSEHGKTIKFTKDRLNWEIEANITLDCLYDVSFEPYDTPRPNAKIIFPYVCSTDSVRVIQESVMQKEYPLCWAYLNHYKEGLSKRSIGGGKKEEKTWYQFGRSQNLTLFQNSEKLIWPVLSTKANYAYDNIQLQFTGGGNGPYYSLIPNGTYSIYYLMGILSHPALEALVKVRASEFRGGYYSHGKQFIQDIPIKEVDLNIPAEKALYDSIISKVQAIIQTKAHLNGTKIGRDKALILAKLNHLNKQLNENINQLYKLSGDEVSLISGSGLFVAESDTEE